MLAFQEIVAKTKKLETNGSPCQVVSITHEALKRVQALQCTVWMDALLMPSSHAIMRLMSIIMHANEWRCSLTMVLNHTMVQIVLCQMYLSRVQLSQEFVPMAIVVINFVALS